jgi:outer membrane biosynthesis protein TonB
VFPKVQIEKSKKPTTFEVVLAQPQQTKVVAEPLPQEPILESLPEPIKPKKIIAQKPNKTPKPPVFKVPDVLATNKHIPETLPQPENKPKEAPLDMMAAINAKRAERESREAVAAKINAEAAAREAGPSEEEIRDTKIKSNFQNGTNGVFEIISLGSHSASFSFLGWLNDYSTSKRQYFEVEASTGQDVRLVMIRRMIGLIREHYQGDFNWESHRLGRTVVKSARVEDGAELEEFLMTEFFGPNYKTAI